MKVVTVTIAERSRSIDSGCFNVHVQTRRLEWNGSAHGTSLVVLQGLRVTYEKLNRNVCLFQCDDDLDRSNVY